LFADFLSLAVQRARIRSPVTCLRAPHRQVRIKAGDAKRLKKFLQLQKDGVLMGSKNISEDPSTGVIDRMLQPARVDFLSYKAPHLVQFRLLYAQELVKWLDYSGHTSSSKVKG
jgi:hypothetical protein